MAKYQHVDDGGLFINKLYFQDGDLFKGAYSRGAF